MIDNHTAFEAISASLHDFIAAPLEARLSA
jgi:hypothetical protein